MNSSQAIAKAIYDIGTDVVTFVPGFGGNEVFSEYCALSNNKMDISFHEEVAYSIAHGAALTGKRAVTLMKSQGIVKAGNSIIGSLCAGTTAGFVNIIFHDDEGSHSDGLFEAVAFLDGISMPYMVGNMDCIYDDIFEMAEFSERKQLPTVLLIDSNRMDNRICCSSRKLDKSKPSYMRNAFQHIVMPPANAYQRKVLVAKKSNEDWNNIKKPKLPNIPEELPAAWKNTAEQYSALFEIFRSVRGDLVTGDAGITGFFGFPPYNCIDILTYLGGSIPLAIGAYLAGYQNVWALTGDFSYIAAGHLGIIEAVQRNIPLKVLIFNNGQSACTGGQKIDRMTFESILSGYTKYVRRLTDTKNAHTILPVLNEANDSKELRIIVAEY